MGFVRTGKSKVFFLGLGLIIALGITSIGAQEATKVSGKMTLTVTPQDSIVIGDEAGHIMTVGMSEGKNINTGDNTFMDGAQVINVSCADMTKGTGVNQGYVIFTKDDDTTYGKWEGTITTVLSAEGSPDVSIEGVVTFINGTGQFENIKGTGSYKGKFSSETEYSVEWQGEYTIAK